MWYAILSSLSLRNAWWLVARHCFHQTLSCEIKKSKWQFKKKQIVPGYPIQREWHSWCCWLNNNWRYCVLCHSQPNMSGKWLHDGSDQSTLITNSKGGDYCWNVILSYRCRRGQNGQCGYSFNAEDEERHFMPLLFVFIYCQFLAQSI